MARTFSIVLLALALAITASYREAFFASPSYEEGDSASNALQIHRAKHFREIHGNYSQWGFYHPGPAFFYVYALGEAVLHDTLHVTPAPRNAHTYTGTLLQLAFYAAAIALLAGHSRQPALIVVLAVAAGALHYAHADRVFYSTWPPDVLLMPMLCFIVACAAAGVGGRVALPVMVIAGGFLVHGHIAQPLFVVPMASVALLGAVRNSPDGWRGLARSRAGVIAMAFLALFLLPIVVDVFSGRASNLHNILLHLRYQSDAGQTLWQSVLCYGSYFLGMNDPSGFNQLKPGVYEPFARHAWLVTLWLAVIAAVAWRFFRTRDSSTTTRFGRALLSFWLIASGLTLIWGMKQDGGLTNYNSHFNHSLVHALALIAVLAIVERIPSVPRVVCTGAGVGAVATFALAVRFEPEVDTRGRDVAERLPAILAADPKPSAPKLILFSGDDWYEAVTLARALQRVNVDFAVHPANQIMFGADKVLHDARDVSVWQVASKEVTAGRSHVLNRNCRVIFPDETAVDAWPVRFDFTHAGEQERAIKFGIGKVESAWTWTDASIAALSFSAPPAHGPLVLTLEASGLATRLTPRGQRVRVFVNGRLLATETFPDPRRTARVEIPVELWNACAPRRIALELPDALAPSELGDSADRRLLGLRLYELMIAPANAAR